MCGVGRGVQCARTAVAIGFVVDVVRVGSELCAGGWCRLCEMGLSMCVNCLFRHL